MFLLSTNHPTVQKFWITNGLWCYDDVISIMLSLKSFITITQESQINIDFKNLFFCDFNFEMISWKKPTAKQFFKI